jgi:hypothetical protein
MMFLIPLGLQIFVNLKKSERESGLNYSFKDNLQKFTFKVGGE